MKLSDFKFTHGPYKMTGMSKKGPWFKIKGTYPGTKFSIARSPFNSINGTFYDVEEAEANARLLGASWDMVKFIIDYRENIPNTSSHARAIDEILNKIK